jgi:hypothetical protein
VPWGIATAVSKEIKEVRLKFRLLRMDSVIESCRQVEHLVTRRKTPHDVLFVIIVLVLANMKQPFGPRISVGPRKIDCGVARRTSSLRPSLAETATIPVSTRRACGRSCARKLGARAISPDQHVAGRPRSVLEAGVNVALRIVLKSNTPLAVVNDIVESFAEDTPQWGWVASHPWALMH